MDGLCAGFFFFSFFFLFFFFAEVQAGLCGWLLEARLLKRRHPLSHWTEYSRRNSRNVNAPYMPSSGIKATGHMLLCPALALLSVQLWLFSLSSSGCFSLLPWLLFSASLALFFMAVFVPLPGATIFLFWTCISLIKRTCSHSLHTLFFCLTLPSLTHCLLWLTMLLKPSSQTHSFSQAISV